MHFVVKDTSDGRNWRCEVEKIKGKSVRRAEIGRATNERETQRHGIQRKLDSLTGEVLEPANNSFIDSFSNKVRDRERMQ